MATRPDKQSIDSELRDLWARRADLDAAGMSRLCEIVLSVLQSCRPQELASLSEDNDVYVIGFIENKVLRRDLLSRCDHTGALLVFYRRYLLDEIRREKRIASLEVADHQDDDAEEERSLVAQASADAASECDPLASLVESGYSCQQIADSARRWLISAEEWVRVFVAYSNCPDADRSEPLVKLARRHGIKSQHYKAEKLGFNWGKGTHEGFEDTLIGRWIVSLGIDICPENAPLVLGALKILCFEALNWAEQQGPAA